MLIMWICGYLMYVMWIKLSLTSIKQTFNCAKKLYSYCIVIFQYHIHCQVITLDM